MERSQSEMAALIGVPYATWKNLEAGRDVRRPVYTRAVEMLLVIHRGGLLMPLNPLRFYVRMTQGNRFAVFDSVRQYDAGVFVEHHDAEAFRVLLTEREERRVEALHANINGAIKSP